MRCTGDTSSTGRLGGAARRVRPHRESGMRWMMLLSVLAAGPACAAVVDAQAGGFQVQSSAVIVAPPDKVYAALIRPGMWWSSEHTYSGDARNETLDARAGGCWCEALPGGGSVQHMTVVFADPGKVLRVRGGLGPLQGLGVDAALTWSLKAAPGGATLVSQTYVVGGYAPSGLAALAAPVDQVLTEQFGRLKSYVETGKPSP